MSEGTHPDFLRIRKAVMEKFPEKELWPTYYERRYLEFLTFFELLPKKKFRRILELGCGLGYYSAFLSLIADEVVATDLETFDPQTHSVGLQETREILSELKITNVKVMHASANDLPFDNEHFDLVFSSHVLEHVPNVNKAIDEINRVLVKGGLNFAVVPTRADRILTLPSFYTYLFKGIIVKGFAKLKPKKNSDPATLPVDNEHHSMVKLHLKHFPFPPPHGVLSSYVKEVKYWSLAGWKRIITKENKIELVKQYGLQINPILPLSGTFVPGLGVKAYSVTRKVENKLAGYWFFKGFGISTLLITKKN
jgi:SAM-dependent methyltransferase